MLLVIDVGNTETVIGLYAADAAESDAAAAAAAGESLGVGIGTEHDPTAPAA